MNGLTATGKLSGAERVGLTALLWASIAGLLISVVSTGFQVFGIWQGNTELSVPVANSYFPELAEDNPRIQSGSYDRAWITVSGLPVPASLLLTAAALLRNLVMVSICVAMVLVCRRILQYKPFAKTSQIALVVVGSIFVAAAALPGMFESMATMIAAESLGLPGPDQIDSREVVDFPFLTVDFPLIALGLFFGVIATALQMGARMQLDGALRAGMPPQDPPNDGLRP